MSSFLCAGIRINDVEENRRITNRVNALANLSGDLDVFWSDRSFASAMVKFRDRVDQVHKFFETCRDSLAMVWETMFPLDPKPQSLLALLKEFKNPAKVQCLVRRELVSGAKVAFAFALARYPKIDLLQIANGPPPGPDGNPLDLEFHYLLAHEPARIVIDKVEAETENVLLARAEEVVENL